MPTIGLITGTGFYALDAGLAPRERRVTTPFGEVAVEEAAVHGHRLVAVARHGTGHARLSHQVRHRANLWSLAESGAGAILATSVVGLLDPALPLARPLLFDDLYFPSNRLPDGSPATFFVHPSDPRRGHFIPGEPFSPALRRRLAAAAAAEGIDVVAGGCYVHVDGPRLNTRAEIAALRAVGGTAVSQTCGPEAVLAGELELPYALLGFGVDYANGVAAGPTPPEALRANLQRHAPAATAILLRLLADLPADAVLPFDTGAIFRME